jgi:hypothetical protein
MASTRTLRTYALTEFPNDKANALILGAQIVAAGLSSATLSAVTEKAGTVIVAFDGLLSSADEATLDAVIAAHQGDDFIALPQTATSESESTDDSGAEQTKLTLSVGPLPEGSYMLSWYSEIRTDAEVANTAAQVRLYVDKNGGGEVERGEKTWQFSQYNQFSGSFPFAALAGDTYELRLAYERLGGSSNPVSIQRARLGIARLE